LHGLFEKSREKKLCGEIPELGRMKKEGWKAQIDSGCAKRKSQEKVKGCGSEDPAITRPREEFF
jgi:hypothetical protein